MTLDRVSHEVSTLLLCVHSDHRLVLPSSLCKSSFYVLIDSNSHRLVVVKFGVN